MIRLAGWTIVAACVVASSGATVGARESAPRVDEPPPAQATIDAAVARGVAFLRTKQSGDGSFGPQPGATGLALLALRHSGVETNDPTCLRATASLLRELPDGTSYGASLGLVALLAQEGETTRKRAASLVGDLVRAQCANGQWTYAARGATSAAQGDDSNTQIAVFALAAARARGIDVPRAAFERTLGFFRATRNADGGWGYAERQRRPSYGSMTAGGAMSVALCLDSPPPGDAKLRDTDDLRGAFKWLAERFDPASNVGAADAFGAKKDRRGDAFWRHYWLWSLERACSVAGVEKLGPHDWYAAGARRLLATQLADGSWRGPEQAELATSFALLFFARGSLRVVTPRAPAVVVATPR